MFVKTNAQQTITRDSVVQLYGVIMTADSLRAIGGASVIVVDKGRGTITNNDGVFSIAVLKGDKITFSCIGFKDKTIYIPHHLQDNQYSVIQLMINDTAYLPATIIRSRPTREQFERDFVSTSIPDDAYEIARQNTDEAKRRVLINSLPPDGREAVNYQLRQQANKYYYAGQLPPMNILNPMAWAEFIKSWKRGDFKRKKK
ncbi:MAG: carboxypeptidase-like regulatory domain-containing protein [Chitinophagales bacterium]|nr:carboxypeptidase-like regulatory domain-containing protein [Chitinophagales bacterium]